MRYFLGVDLGGTKTHMIIADETGRALGFGEGGPGNHQNVGFDGMVVALQTALEQALDSAKLQREDLAGAGFGIAGYDWPNEKPDMLATIERLGLRAPCGLVNDAIPGLVAGAQEGWGVNVVSGTGCNCRGWDKEHKREGRVTGYGITMGEAAGSSELVFRAIQLVGFEWTRRGPRTALSNTFIMYAGAKSLEDLLEGYTEGYYQIGAETAPLVFQAAYEGDDVARNLITWAGNELGEMANGVIRQLNFEDLAFDVVLSGSMFEGGALLIDPMRAMIQKVAPKARLVRLNVPPVLGAVLIGMEQGKVHISAAIRATLAETIRGIKNNNGVTA
jgi:N-acetylglucosamine kinase-like BadF-type ATPase